MISTQSLGFGLNVKFKPLRERRKFCRKGHALTEHNIYKDSRDSSVVCRTCKILSAVTYKQKKRGTFRG